MPLSIRDYDFQLPPELIAQHPLATRTGSRLLAVAGDTFDDLEFSMFPDRIAPGSLMVFNDTRVIKARLLGEKDSGGKVEVLIERILSEREALAHVRASKAPKSGSRMLLENELQAEMLGRDGEFFHLRFACEDGLLAALERVGRVPLPPYITHSADESDIARYQTVYARAPGAVAAPTAGLHFDEPAMKSLAANGINTAFLTLHVGAGTFQPVRVDDLNEHRMHSEWYSIPEPTRVAVQETRRRGGAIVAVGTTSVRALESAASGPGELRSGSGDTRLFITPGYRFQIVDRLITNFHLPRSTLLVLVSAFAGGERIRRAYAHAIAGGYRFFSYGDAMLLDRAPAEPGTYQ